MLKTNAEHTPLHTKTNKVDSFPRHEKTIARYVVRQEMIDYLLGEGDELDHAYMVNHGYGLQVNTLVMTDGSKIIYNDFGGIGEIRYYNAKGHCYMTVEE